MLNPYLKKGIFLENRLTFEGKANEKLLADIGNKAATEGKKTELSNREKAIRDAALKAAKEETGGAIPNKPGAKPGDAGAKAPGQPTKLPEIPADKKLNGFEPKGEGAINKNTGLYEQEFKFGDQKIPVKVSLPSKPEDGKPTTYLFNYVADPDKITPEEQKKLFDKIKENKDKLGNTVIITMKTSEGTVNIDKKQVNTMESLVAGVEKFQQNLEANPKTKDIKMPRASHFLYMMNQSDEKQVKAVTEVLSKYAEAAGKNDTRITEFLKVLDNTTPENFASSLDTALKAKAEADKQPEDSSGSPAGGPGKKSGGGGAGGGGAGAGAGNSGGSGGEGSGASPSGSPGGKASESPQPQASTDSKEAYSESVNKLLIFGDSLMTGAEGKIKANSVEKTSAVGKAFGTMLKEMKTMDSSKKLENYRNETILIDGGVNDIAAGRTAEDIIKDMKEFWAIAKKYDIKVFSCTLTPFEGAVEYPSLTKDFADKEKIRNKVNDDMIALAGTGEGPYKIIPLHKEKKDGGLAEDGHPSALAKDFAAPDKLHLTPQGYEKMAEFIQGTLGNPKKKPTASPSPAIETGGKSTLVAHAEKGEEYDQWARQINADFIKDETPFGTFKVVDRNGQKLLAKHVQHNEKGATGEKGVFAATEIYEYNAAYDPDVKKKADSEIKKIPDSVDKSKYYEELTIEDGKANAIIDYPPNFDPSKPTEILFYATPNGSHSKDSYGENQKVKKQIEELRNGSEKYKGKNLVLVIAGPNTPQRWWSEYKAPNNDIALPIFNQLNQRVKDRYGLSNVEISLDGHSGGGGFMFNLIEKSAEIPQDIHTIDFYDSLYNYNKELHLDKLLNWLNSDSQNRLNMITGTPPVIAHQQQLIADLKQKGIEFETTIDKQQSDSEGRLYTERKALNGQITIKDLKQYGHGQTIYMNGMASVKDPNSFDMKVV